MTAIFENVIKMNPAASLSSLFELESPTYSQYISGIQPCAISNSLYDLMVLDNEYIYHGKNYRNHTIIFSIRKKTMLISAYGLEATANTYGRACLWAYPTSWNVYGSNIKGNWNLIDSKPENKLFNVPNQLKIFNLTNNYHYKYIKLQVNTSMAIGLIFGFSRFELFGVSLFESFFSYSNSKKSSFFIFTFITNPNIS